MNQKKEQDKSNGDFYITTTLPYVNAAPHIGFAMEIIRADVIARYKKYQGFNVFFNTGTDEHGLKIHRASEKEGIETQKYVDMHAEKFLALKESLGLLGDIHFIRTTDKYHILAAQEFWRRADKAGFIYKKKYKIKYCVGCELEKTDSELVDGKCEVHPHLDIELIDEENYFFKFKEFQKPLLDLYEKYPDLVIPDFRFNEVKSFVERGLEDFSISRLASKMPWGVPVPDDEEQVMYVWFDALVNYISTLGWPEDNETFEKFWAKGTPVQYCGKDNIRQQSAIWQAMLMSVGLPPTRHIVVNGFITGEGGVKMSKSLGNTIDPKEIVDEYGTDALRYFLLREISSFEDSPFTEARFKEAYNAGLANGLGNLTSRVMKMVVNNGVSLEEFVETKPDGFDEKIENFDLKGALDLLWLHITYLDAYIQENKPFSKIKTDPEGGKKDLIFLLNELKSIAVLLAPFLPETSVKIIECVEQKKTPEKPLFLRKE